jgi:hypothetical protein
MSKKEVEKTEEVDLGEPAALEVKKPRKQRTKSAFSRKDYPFCIFVGTSSKPKFWAKTEEEARGIISKISPSKLDNVQLASLRNVVVQVEIKIG